MTGLHPYGSLRTDEGPHVVVRVGDQVLDLTRTGDPLFAEGNLDRLLGAGRPVWEQVHREVRALVEGGAALREPGELLLPFTVADYVDFYSSEHHARNVGRIFRPGTDPLPAAWKHLPLGYHGRAGTVVVSGTPVVRPCGPHLVDGHVVSGPSTRLDLEAEVGFVVGTPSAGPVTQDALPDHVFGVCLVNDWSARDVQAFEYVPLGPFLGKAFATSVSPWVVPLSALEHARVPPPARDVPLLPHLDDAGHDPWGLDLQLEVRLNGTVVSRPPFASTYWTPAQQLAHLTSGGATLRTGDLFASGTVSGRDRHQWGSLLELSWGGSEPVLLDDGSTRTFLEDGDEVVVSATAPGPGGTRLDLGEVRGRVTDTLRA